MAKKQRVRIKNSRPRHNWLSSKIKNTAGPGSSSASGTPPESCVDPGHTGGGSETIDDVVKHSIHEVGQVGSSFPGNDSYNKPMEGVTFADREKLYVRYDLIEELVENGLVDEDGFPSDSDIAARQYVYDQPVKERQKGSGSQKQKIMIRKEEDSTVLLPTYDEQYFQHIFNWPETHTLRTRKIAGFIEKTCTTTSTTSGGTQQDPTSCTTTRTDVTIEKQEQNYVATFELDDVQTEIYQANPAGDSIKGDQVWNYDPLTFDLTTGELQNKDSDLRGKLGHPIVYSGDGNSNAIFFNYIPEPGAHSTTVTHNFDDDNNIDISFTAAGDITVEPKNRGDKGRESGPLDSLNRKYYEITFPKTILNTANIKISNGTVTASGISLERMFLSKLTQISDNKVRVWFVSDTGDNSFVRSWTVSMGGGEKSTKNVIATGDVVNGSTVTNVVNYIEEVALVRNVVGHPKKGVQDSKITSSAFILLSNADGSSQGLTVVDYQRTRAWIKVNSATDIIKGMDVQGDGIKNITTNVTGVDYTNNIVYISDTIKQKKIKSVKFIDDQCNRVSQHTLCYATLSGGNDFVMDQNYSVSRSGQNVCDIVVKAGKGIKNRSAVVGTWFSDVKHEIEYQPIFYGSDAQCEKEMDGDNFGEYTLGTIIWNDNTRTESVYLLTDPADNFAYTASQVHFALTYAPIDQATLNKIDMEVASELSSADINSSLGRMNQADPVLTSRYIIFNKVSEHCKNVLGGKKASAVYDDICRDDIQPLYFNMYDPINEQFSLGTNLTAIEQNIDDYCGVTNPRLNPAIQGVEIAAQNSTVLPEEYYKQFAGNPDSLLNRLKSGFDIVENARPKNKVLNLPPQIVGEDQSGRIFTSKSFRNLPPRTDRVGYFCNDLVVTDDKYLNPILDLDPQTTVNQPKIIIRSKPIWKLSGSTNNPQTWNITIPSGAGNLNTTMTVNVNEAGDGRVNNITTTHGPGDSATITTGFPPNTTTITCSIAWITLRSKEADGNIVFCTRDAFPGVYTISTNVTRPPGGDHKDIVGAKTNLRDLLYKERPKDEDVLATDDDDYDNSMLHLPTHEVYPQVVWEPNVSYQQDFYKMFEFRLQEHSELIGETIANKGNPYVDRAITTKLRENLDLGDNTIVVESTGEFLSSGYLIIPKYIQKIIALETGNNNSYYYYSGEEIIYYQSKTETTFNGIERGMFGTTSSFEDIVSVESIEPGVVYKIASLGSSNWKRIGAGKNPSVGDVFTAKSDGIGTGTVIVFGTTFDALPDEELLTGLLSNPKLPVITSYEKGFSIAQHAVFTLKH